MASRSTHLSQSHGDKISNTARSEVSSLSLVDKRRSRPLRSVQRAGTTVGRHAMTRRRTSTRTSTPDVAHDSTEEASDFGDRFVHDDSPDESHMSPVREACEPPPVLSNVRSRTVSVGQNDQPASTSPKLKLSLGNISRPSEAGEDQPSAPAVATGLAVDDVLLPTMRSAEALPTVPLSTSSEQLSSHSALAAKRPSIRIKPFSESSSMSPISAAYAHMAASRGHGPLTPSADSYSRPTPASGLSAEQEAMLRESHSMLQKQNDMLGSLSDAIKGLRMQGDMGAINSLSSLVSRGTAPGNGV
ncbi:hypothetical protein IWW38_004626, partial [Coemansia aciculifera]